MPRSLRRSLAAVCTAAFAIGLLGVAGIGSAGAGAPRPSVPATPAPPGGGVQILVEQEPQPAGWISST